MLTRIVLNKNINNLRKWLIALELMLLALYSNAQQISRLPNKPKLVIGIVVDQMRYDYLFRYSDKFNSNGFAKLLKNGFIFRNAQYPYVPTYTGPGHAAIYTGATPSNNGIIANDWYERSLNKSVYVTEDTTVQGVGGSGKESQMSPRRLLSTTVTDELRLATNKKSKVIGIALKDRGSILPAGHIPNAAYWYDSQSGNWITSDYYMGDLPKWVKYFNEQKLADKYLSKPWITLYDISTYTNGLPNGAPYRNAYKGEAENRFPHNLPALIEANGYELLKKTPFGNSMTLDFAIAAIKAENLGKNQNTDFLAISFSSTDYVGHQFGIQSIEVQDTYARLDKELERLLAFIDQYIGAENVLLFLTADHGAVETPAYMQSMNIPGGIFKSKGIKKELNNHISSLFGDGKWILDYENLQFYLNTQLAKEKKVNIAEIENACITFLQSREGVYKVYSSEALSITANDYYNTALKKGLHPLRSGNIAIQLLPGWFDADYAATGGTTHGSGYSYDTHVPLIWYGWKVKAGSSGDKVSITDIAPTVADILNISYPNGTNGSVLSDIFLHK